MYSVSFIPSKLYYNNGFSYATHLIITCGMALAKLTRFTLRNNNNNVFRFVTNQAALLSYRYHRF